MYEYPGPCYQGTMAMRAGRFDLAMPNVARAYELFMKVSGLVGRSVGWLIRWLVTRARFELAIW